MIYLSAGHNKRALNPDPGAIGFGGVKEADLTIELRELVLAAIRQKRGEAYRVVTDKDTETLGEYLSRIRPGTGSVVCELHFNASDNKYATGVEVIIPERYTIHEHGTAVRLCDVLGRAMGISNRGAKPESNTARGRLGLMRKEGINLLIEICFISNEKDLAAYRNNRFAVANAIATLLLEADDFIV